MKQATAILLAAMAIGCVGYEPHPNPPDPVHVELVVDVIEDYLGEDFSGIKITWAGGDCLDVWRATGDCPVGVHGGFFEPNEVIVIYWGPETPIRHTALAHELLHEHLDRSYGSGDRHHRRAEWGMLEDINERVLEAEIAFGWCDWDATEGKCL